LVIKPSGNGLAIRDRYGKHSAKASKIDRALSKASLEKLFGQYEAPTREQHQDIKAEEVYSAVPLHLGRNGTNSMPYSRKNWLGARRF
jgi:hypothetical protein